MMRITLMTLVSFFVINYGWAADIKTAGSQLACDDTDLHSDTSAQFMAVWCQECTAESLLSTNCQLTVSEDISDCADTDSCCSYSGSCKQGYENLQDSGTATMHCSPIVYTITYNGVDDAVWGTDAIHPNSYTIQPSDILISAPIRYGYEFLGWCADEDSCDEPVTEFVIPGGSADDIALYAQWQLKDYTITYKNMDDDVKWPDDANHPTSYTVQSADILISAPVRKGYDFVGWCENVDTCDNPRNPFEILTGSYGDIDLYPQWSEKTYVVAFKANSAEVTNTDAMENQTCSYSECVLNKNLYTRPGYKFNGWVTIDGNVTYADEDTILNNSENITLYAQWTNFSIECLAGQYLAKGDYEKCTKCEIGFYCPDRKVWYFNPDVDQGKKSCASLMKDNSAKTDETDSDTIGSDSVTDCWVVCNATMDGYVIDQNNNKQYYGVASDSCKYMATVRYQTDTNCADQVFYKGGKALLNLCVPEAPVGKTFVGWLDNVGTKFAVADNKTLENIDPEAEFTPKNGYVDMKPIWEIDKYSITYDCSANAKTIVDDDLEYGEEVTLIDYSSCDNPGYTFNAWNCDVALVDGNKMPASNIYCQADITVNTYDVKFDGNGAESGTVSDMTGLEYGKSYNLNKNNFTRTGYDFVGWCDDLDETTGECKGNIYSNEQSIYNLAETDGDIVVLYAMWTLHKYNITYVLPSGVTANPQNPTYYYVTTETFTLNNPTKQGNDFIAWCSNSAYTEDCTKTKTIAKGTTGDLTFYAHMDIEIYNIYYKYIDENNNVIDLDNLAPSTYTYGDMNYYPTTVSIPGYKFQGWYIDSSLKYKTFYTSVTSTGDITVYAKVDRISCPVDNYVSGGDCKPCGTHSYNDDEYATECTCDTYYEKDSGGACVAQEYTISYELNGGTNYDGAPTSYTVETEPISLGAPTKDGYEFAGWYKNSKFTGNEITEIPGDLTGDITLYAAWEGLSCQKDYYIINNECKACPDNSHSDGGFATECVCDSGYEKDSGGACVAQEYTISYELDGGTNYDGAPTSYTVETEPISLGAPTKDGYEFAGWYKNSKFTGDKITKIPGDLTGDIILYAKWASEPCAQNQYLDGNVCVACPDNSHSDGGFATECTCNAYYEKDSGGACVAQEYTISYELNGGTNYDGAPTSYTVETEPISLGAPTKDGYEFAGWYKNSKFTGNEITEIPGDLTGNIILYAKWIMQAKSTITYICGNNETIVRSDYVGNTVVSPDALECGLTDGVLRWICGRDLYDEREEMIVPENALTCEAFYDIVYKSYISGNEEVLDITKPVNYVPSQSTEYPTSIPSISGYDFKGWYIDKNFRYRTYRTSIGSVGTLVVYAKLEPKTIRCNAGEYLPAGAEVCDVCTVNYYCEGGTYVYSADITQGLTPCPSSYPYSNEGSETVDACYTDCPEKEYNSVVGYVYSNNMDTCAYTPYEPCGENEYMDGNECLPCPGNLSSEGGYVTECGCQNGYVLRQSDTGLQMCELEEYTITYEGLEDASNSNPTTYTVEDWERNIVAPGNREGYVFTGWTKDGVAFTQIPSGLIGDITLVANWQNKNITCNSGKYLPAQSLTCAPCPMGTYCEGGEYEYSDDDTGKTYCPSEYPLSAPESQSVDDCFHQCGYDFDDNTTGVFADGTDTCKYPIIYELNGGQFNSDKYPKYYEHGAGSLVLANPIKAEYTFGGWYENEDMSGNSVTAFDTNRTGPVYLYAKWDFLCASGKWLHLGDEDKVCLYENKPSSSPVIAMEIDGVRYYVMLSEDTTIPVHDGSTRKMHVEVVDKEKTKTYNVHDFSVVFSEN